MIASQDVWNSYSSTNKILLIERIWAARRPSTVEKYCYAIRRFFIYCAGQNIAIKLPIDSLLAANYLVDVSEKNGTKGAVSDALTSLKWLHSFYPGLNSQNDPLQEEFLSRITQSINREKAKMKERKIPLSEEIVSSIISHPLKKPNASLTKLRDALIPGLAFALLLRHDEVAHLSCMHISQVDDGLKIHIPSSKTDTIREGRFVFLSKKHSSLHELLILYMNKAGLKIGMNHFLFCPVQYVPTKKKYSVENSMLSYSTFRTIVKTAVANLGLDPAKYSTHSCRSGGATALATKVSEFELMLTGRWADQRSLGSYVQTSDSRRFEISKQMNLN